MTVVSYKAMSKMAALAGQKAAKEAEAKLAPLMAVLTKHGISDAKVAELGKDVGFAGLRDPKAANEQAAALISNKRAFISDMFDGFTKMAEAEGQSPADAFKGELQDLQVNGNTATATIFNANGKQKKRPITFENVEGKGWLIDVN